MPSFSKEEKVAFDLALEGFQDAGVISKLFKKQTFDGTEAERTGNVFWRPMPYVAQSFDGIDQSANFNRNYVQLSVPATLGYSKSVPLTMSATELRDALQEQRLGKAAMQRLASDVNVSCSNLAALTGTVVIKRSAAASGYDDVAAIDDAFNRLGVQMDGRKLCLPSNHYNGMASNLAGRQTLTDKALTAYERAAVGTIANFDTFKLDYGYRLTAAAGTTVTVNGANQYYTPKATSTAGTGETSNVDNRYQNLTIGVTSGTVKVGDCFTIAGVNEVHHITKADTGSLKTFRITGIVSGGGGAGVVQISPPIISAGGGTDAEKQYQNVTAAPANGAAITFLNTAASVVAPFWQDEAFEIIPGKYQPKEESGLSIMSATTDNGLTVTMARQGSIGDLSCKYRWDVFYGLVNLQPQMSGIELFGQP
ncbi:P22 phage major capsid protein family protein [Massilia sp. ZL223]|uniref:P22 phage major capsid protein family protein n=1 Tax=Massilia sp. ZL223 TaxID=2824904 RepID=UPI001B836F61|nr:P22 phage major capsid protein family protein [Massilia sp. ZL223]MBQ5963152.1 hypothetical protein [Massilia sp. ZL223]